MLICLQDWMKQNGHTSDKAAGVPNNCYRWTNAGYNLPCRSQWSSGSMSDCSARGPGVESRCGQLCLSHNHYDLQPWARAVCTFPAVPRSTQPSTLRGTVNEYQLSGWVIIINGDGGCIDASCLQADSQPKSGGLVWGSTAACALRCIHQMNRVNSRNNL